MSKDRTETLLEETNHKFDAMMEYVKGIPSMKEQLNMLTKRVEEIEEDIQIIKGSIGEVQSTLDTTFEEVGRLRVDVEVLKKEMEKAGGSTAEIKDLQRRVEKIEQQA